VLGELVRAKPPEAPKARETAEAPKAPEGVDASVIDDLLGGGEGGGKDSGR
jgi:hypothetical protein